MSATQEAEEVHDDPVHSNSHYSHYLSCVADCYGICALAAQMKDPRLKQQENHVLHMMQISQGGGVVKIVKIVKIVYSFCSAGKRNALLLILLMAGPLMSAQQLSLRVVPGHSTARVFLGTPENPTSFDVGVAKVAGEMQFSSDDIGASRFNLTIYSADLKDLKVYGERSVIAFQSQSIEQNREGKLEVRGQMTVTQVFGEEGADADYSGNSGSSKRLRTSQRVTFVFDGLGQPGSTAGLSGESIVPVQENGSEPGILVTAIMSVDGETFPQLLLTIQDVAWPLAADDESCATRSKSGEDYREVTCEEATSSASIAQPGADQQTPPAGNLVTIQLKLILVSADSDSAEE